LSIKLREFRRREIQQVEKDNDKNNILVKRRRTIKTTVTTLNDNSRIKKKSEEGKHIVRNQQEADSADVESIKKIFDQLTLDSVLESIAKRSKLSNPLIGITRGSLQVDNPLIRSTNFTTTRGINLDRRGNDHIKALTTDNVETSGYVNDSFILLLLCSFLSFSARVICFSNVIFAKDLFKVCKMVEELGLDLDEEMPLCLAVANLASQRHCTSNSLKMAFLEMIKDMSNLDFWNGEQQDAQEFLTNILNMMQEGCDKILREQHNIDYQQERNK
uniref:UCH domain-containing protein n=1 Tax=Brugia timori TaxID=42155 RepID=A0A0R3R9V8_9BILA